MIPMHSLPTFQVPSTSNSHVRLCFTFDRKSSGLVGQRQVRTCVASMLKQLCWLLPRRPSLPSTTTFREPRSRKTIPLYTTGSQQRSSHRRSLVLYVNSTLARMLRRKLIELSPRYVHSDFCLVTLSLTPQLDGRGWRGNHHPCHAHHWGCGNYPWSSFACCSWPCITRLTPLSHVPQALTSMRMLLQDPLKIRSSSTMIPSLFKNLQRLQGAWREK